MRAETLPRSFFWRRIHSLTGLWISLYLIEHLFVNSQAALLFGTDGKGFVEAVNGIKNLPYLPIIEILLLGLPIATHLIWGVAYLFQTTYNSAPTDGSAPSLPEYGRNKAYTWQRVTAWLLLFGIIAHVVHMRLIEYPAYAQKDTQGYHMVRVTLDPGIYTLADRLDVKLYTAEQVAQLNAPVNAETNPNTPEGRVLLQKEHQEKLWLEALRKRPLGPGEGIAVSKNFGTAELLMLRETFKMPLMIVLYTVFVITACFHAYNGMWTFMIKWGITLSRRAQLLSLRFTTFLMFTVAFWGLITVWGSYWNLKQ
jgi:succinate dehydrogenase / fumarate reductase, cytochrome b subunit